MHKACVHVYSSHELDRQALQAGFHPFVNSQKREIHRTLESNFLFLAFLTHDMRSLIAPVRPPFRSQYPLIKWMSQWAARRWAASITQDIRRTAKSV